ncbi:MAG: tyrosine-type recombinase/integrase [Dongiaceae bacterium]
MARTVRDTKLETREARARLARRKKPHWRTIDQGAHVGYYKGARGGSWIARYFRGEGRYTETALGTADDKQDADGVAVLSYRQAQEKARAWFVQQARIKEGLGPVPAGPYTVADAMRDYLADYAERGRAVQTTETAIDAHILPVLGQREVARLTKADIQAWHRTLAKTPARLRSGRGKPVRHKPAAHDAQAKRRRRATANRVLTVLKAALNHAWREGKVAGDEAWRRVRPFKNVDAPVVRYLTEGECVRLVNACPPDFRPMVQAALLTGCRYGELAALRAADFNPDAGTLAVRASKSGKARHVVLTAEGQRFFAGAVAGKASDALILARPDGKAWGHGHQRRPLLEGCKRARISPPASFHILRHSHGSTLAMKGVPLPVIAQQLGHSDTRMTEKHYAHLSPSYVADAIRAGFPELGIVKVGKVAALKPRKR